MAAAEHTGHKEHVREPRNNFLNDVNSTFAETEKIVDNIADKVSEKAQEFSEELHNGRWGGDQYHKARQKIKSALHVVQDKIPHVKEKAVTHTKHAAHVTDEYVDANPWRAVGVAAVIGLLVGVVIGRGR